MNPEPSTEAPGRFPPRRRLLGAGRWLALLAAGLGWMFDGFEMGLHPLVAYPALRELLGPGVAAKPRSGR